MENFPKPNIERATEDERVENPMDGMHVEDTASVGAPESASIPEAPAGVSEFGMQTGVNDKLEAQANAILEGTSPEVEQRAPLMGEAPAGEDVSKVETA